MQNDQSHAELLSEMEIHAEVLRSRSERKPAQSVRTAFENKNSVECE